MADWQSRPFEDCIEPVIYTTKVQRKDFLAAGAFPVVSQEDAFVNGFWDIEADLFRVDRPVVAFGDHTRALKYIDFDFVLGADGVKILKPKPFLHPRFFYYQLHTAKLDSLGYARHYRLLKEHHVAYPAYAEQQRITAILDEAFEGIATAKANAEKNLQNARELFDLQLVTTLRRGGEGWVETSIGEACTLRSGTTVPVGIERAAGDVPYVKVAEMTMPANRDGVTTSIRFLDRREIKQSWLIPAGAVIFPKRGGAILTNKKRLVLVDICVDLNIMSVIPSEKITAEFLYLYFLTVDMRKLGTGSSIPQINNYDIAPLSISFPPSRAMQAEVTEVLRSAESECQALSGIYERKILALDELKKSLLHQAFTGALSAKFIDEELEAVA